MYICLVYISIAEAIKCVNDEHAVPYTFVQPRHPMKDLSIMTSERAGGARRDEKSILINEAQAAALVLRVIVQRQLYSIGGVCPVLMKINTTVYGTYGAAKRDLGRDSALAVQRCKPVIQYTRIPPKNLTEHFPAATPDTTP